MKKVICLCQLEDEDDRYYITQVDEDEEEINYTSAGSGPHITDNGKLIRERDDLRGGDYDTYAKHIYFNRRRAIQIIKQYFPDLDKIESPADRSIRIIK